LLGAGFDHLVRQVAGGGLALARVGDAGDVRGQRVADGVSAVPVRVVCHARGAPSPMMWRGGGVASRASLLAPAVRALARREHCALTFGAAGSPGRRR
jgi:hypothetical protein